MRALGEMEDTPHQARSKRQTGFGKPEHMLWLHLVSRRALLSLFCFLFLWKEWRLHNYRCCCLNLRMFSKPWRGHTSSSPWAILVGLSFQLSKQFIKTHQRAPGFTWTGGRGRGPGPIELLPAWTWRMCRFTAAFKMFSERLQLVLVPNKTTGYFCNPPKK